MEAILDDKTEVDKTFYKVKFVDYEEPEWIEEENITANSLLREYFTKKYSSSSVTREEEEEGLRTRTKQLSISADQISILQHIIQDLTKELNDKEKSEIKGKLEGIIPMDLV